MKVLLDLLQETKNVLHISAKRLIQSRDESDKEKFMLKRIAREAIEEAIINQIAESEKFIKFSHCPATDDFELSAEVFVINRDELFNLLKKAYTKGKIDADMLPPNYQMLSPKELQAIRDEAYRNGYRDAETSGSKW